MWGSGGMTERPLSKLFLNAWSHFEHGEVFNDPNKDKNTSILNSSNPTSRHATSDSAERTDGDFARKAAQSNPNSPIYHRCTCMKADSRTLSMPQRFSSFNVVTPCRRSSRAAGKNVSRTNRRD